MAYITLKYGDIDTSVIYVSKSELIKRTGISRSTMYNHVTTNKINAYRFRNRTYFHPDDAAKYEEMIKCGLLG